MRKNVHPNEEMVLFSRVAFLKVKFLASNNQKKSPLLKIKFLYILSINTRTYLKVISVFQKNLFYVGHVKTFHSTILLKYFCTKPVVINVAEKVIIFITKFIMSSAIKKPSY